MALQMMIYLYHSAVFIYVQVPIRHSENQKS